MNRFNRVAGRKSYELKDHLGNVRVVINDFKMGRDNTGDSKSDYYLAKISSLSDYGPFGELLEARTANANRYRYGFNGQEKDNEISGSGNSYTAEFWQYDSRLGRRWNVDPIIKEHESPYAAFANNPIWFVDKSGADTMLIHQRTMLPIKNLMRKGGQDVVFVSGNKGTWDGATQLFYELTISGDHGGTKSTEGQPVRWRWKDRNGNIHYLKDQTKRFNVLMARWQIHMAQMSAEIDRTIVPESRYTHKIGYIWQTGTDGAPLDIKAYNKLDTEDSFHPGNIGEWSWYNGRLLRYDDYGNISFGRAAAALGIKDSHSVIGANINQFGKDLKGIFGIDTGTTGFGDSPRDKDMIMWGVTMYRQTQGVRK